MGLVMGDIFRMADSNYEGAITKEQFMKTMMNTKVDIEEPMLNEMYYSIDTSLNGIVEED